MRTYGRTYNEFGNPTWVEVQTSASGQNDYVYITSLAQVLKLNLGESPFYANYGIPAHESVVQQVFPDFFVRRVQSQFSQYFASLIIAKVPLPTPVYNITLVTNNGVTVNANVPVPV